MIIIEGDCSSYFNTIIKANRTHVFLIPFNTNKNNYRKILLYFQVFLIFEFHQATKSIHKKIFCVNASTYLEIKTN